MSKKIGLWAAPGGFLYVHGVSPEASPAIPKSSFIRGYPRSLFISHYTHTEIATLQRNSKKVKWRVELGTVEQVSI